MSNQPTDAQAFLAALQGAYWAQDARLREQHRRSLPLQDSVVDRWQRAKTLGFEDGVSIYNSAIVYGDVKVGRSTWIGPYVVLDGAQAELSIGAWCSISAGVHIYTHDTVAWALSGGRAPYRSAAVSIGDCCYIGSQCVIAAGVTIGPRSVVAANSFVRHDVPPETIVGGTPARPIGRVVFEGDTPRLVFDYEGGDAPSQELSFNPVRQYLETVLVRIAQDRFGQREAPAVRLSPDTVAVPAEGLKGALEISIRTRAGNEPVIHREVFAGVRTRKDVDDLFARALSIVLMNHAEWPR